MRTDDVCRVSDVYVSTCDCREGLRILRDEKAPSCPGCGAPTSWIPVTVPTAWSKPSPAAPRDP